MSKIKQLIDKVIGKEGTLNVPAYWMNKILTELSELKAENSGTGSNTGSEELDLEELSNIIVPIVKTECAKNISSDIIMFSRGTRNAVVVDLAAGTKLSEYNDPEYSYGKITFDSGVLHLYGGTRLNIDSNSMKPFYIGDYPGKFTTESELHNFSEHGVLPFQSIFDYVIGTMLSLKMPSGNTYALYIN